MLSLFGFLLAMGVLVDDAIIIGESIFAKQEAVECTGFIHARNLLPTTFMAEGRRNLAYLQAAISGAREVSLPVIVAVMIVLVAFLPGLFLPGWAGQMMKPICLVDDSDAGVFTG